MRDVDAVVYLCSVCRERKNVFFSDVTHCVSTEEAALFADDLTIFQQFKRTEENEFIKRHMHVCRTRVHKWTV